MQETRKIGAVGSLDSRFRGNDGNGNEGFRQFFLVRRLRSLAFFSATARLKSRNARA